MAKVTEQDVISFLKDKVAALNAELKKTQAALDAFSGAPEAAGKPEKLTETESIRPVKTARGRKPVASKGAVKPLEAPVEFDPKGKLDDKIAYVIGSSGRPLFNTEIIEQLAALEPEKDPGKIEKAAMVKLSALYKAGKIKAEKEGRKFKYQL